MVVALKLLGTSVFLILLVHLFALLGFRQFAGELHTQVASAPPGTLSSAPVPELISDFATQAGVDPNRLARIVTLTQTAEMRLNRGGDWKPLTANQTISIGETGFIWQAEQYLGPFLMFRVIDAFVQGAGRLDVRLFGSLPIAGFTGPDADRGEVMRYLAELIWAPDAMLGNPQLVWKEVADNEIKVRIDLSQGRVEVTFLFDENGDIEQVTAKDRPTTNARGVPILRDWVCKIIAYEEINGRRIPAQVEVGYVYDDGYEAYWRGKIETYELSE